MAISGFDNTFSLGEKTKALVMDKKSQEIEWVNLALEGQNSAFEKLLESYWDKIYDFLNHPVLRKEDVEDLRVITFTKCFTKLYQYNSEYAFSTWLYNIAQNTLIDFYRRNKLNTVSIDSAIELDNGETCSMDLPCTGYNPEEKLIGKQHFRSLIGRIEKLKPEYRCLIELRYFEDRSYEEISLALELPLGTVKNRLHRARTILIESLKDQPL